MLFIDFTAIPQNGSFFRKFIEGDSFALSRFADISIINSESYLLDKAENFHNRYLTYKIIADTMQLLDLSETQKANLTNTTKSNTLFVSTGQQVGFLGGANYTCLKIATAINIAKKLQEQHPKFNIIPIFWLEDNDHDAKEAAEIHIFDANHSSQLFHPDYSHYQNIPVSELVFDEKIEETIEAIINTLPYSPNKEQLADSLRLIYCRGNRWSDSMLLFYQMLFKRYGLLFASAAVARKSGAIAQLVNKNFSSLNDFKNLFEIFSKNKALIASSGHSINISFDYFNYCRHTGKNRYSIRTVSVDNSVFTVNHCQHTYDELVSDMFQNPHSYSPKAILRPIFQEICFPSVLYVLGPSEISYFAMLKEAYEFFGVDFPPVTHRAMACFLPGHHIHFIEQNNIDFAKFFDPLNKFESLISNLVVNDTSEIIFEQVRNEIRQSFSQLTSLLTQADPSLVRTQESYAHKSSELIDNLQKKYIAALKKKNAELVSRLRKIRSILLPQECLQERHISPINYINIYGFENFSKTLNEIADNYVKGFIIY